MVVEASRATGRHVAQFHERSGEACLRIASAIAPSWPPKAETGTRCAP